MLATAAYFVATSMSLLSVGAPHTGMTYRSPVPTIILGGSAAAGWHDKTQQGYVVRGLNRFERYTHQTFAIEQHARSGMRVINSQAASRYPGWMAESRGGMVILAWGFLNDIRLHTPKSLVVGVIHEEISEALATDHTVLVLSPPATEATFTFYHRAEWHMWHAVATMAKGLDSSRVSVVNVMGPMQQDIVAGHQTYRPYMQGRWDPSTAGHVLAGHIFTEQLEMKAIQRSHVGL